MLHKKKLYLLHRRIHKIKCNDMLVFGGVNAVLLGDTGKIPVVRGRFLWKSNPNTENEIYGLNMYR